MAVEFESTTSRAYFMPTECFCLSGRCYCTLAPTHSVIGRGRLIQTCAGLLALDQAAAEIGAAGTKLIHDVRGSSLVAHCIGAVELASRLIGRQKRLRTAAGRERDKGRGRKPRTESQNGPHAG